MPEPRSYSNGENRLYATARGKEGRIEPALVPLRSSHFGGATEPV